MAVSIGMLIPPKLGGLGMEKVVTWAKGVGLGALDLSEDFAEGAGLCREAGLRVGTVSSSAQSGVLSGDERQREAAVGRMLNQIRAMPEAGARLLFLCLVPENKSQPIADSMAIFRETFPTLAAECERAGVQMVLEGWPGPAPYYPTLGCTPEVLRAMFAAVPSAALGVNYDPSHLVRLGIDYLRMLEEFKPRIYHVHGKDTGLRPEARYLYGHARPALDETPIFSGGAWRYCVPGAGVVDWGKVADALAQVGYDGCVSIELEDVDYWGTLEREQAGITVAYQHLAQHFA